MTDQPQNLRGLKAAVGGMGLLIVIGTTVVVGTIIHRLYARESAPPPMVAALSAPAAPGMAPTAVGSGAPPPADTVSLPAGSHISGITAAGPDVAVWVSGPAGDQLWLVNPQTGARYVALATPAPQK